ncbi:MAG TPA: glycosyltransferase family 4 protein, partial [Vicinamibacterales bacterium]
SRWTAEMLERLGELSNPTVLYPPVLDPGEGLPWHEREDQFLCVGRFHESKRIETSISIVKKVRQTVLPRARLIVVGSPVDPAYTSRLRAIASREGDWVRVSENLTRDELNTVMGRSRYGIQAMEAEHFGMATAEMTRAGCLVFAHNSGGSPEVLNHEIGLLWSTEESAVEKIAAITAGPAAGLSATLRRHAGMFSPAMFEERFRKIVEAVHVN